MKTLFRCVCRAVHKREGTGAYVVCGLDVGFFVQKKRRNIRVAIFAGQMKGRVSALLEEGGRRKTTERFERVG